MSSKRSQQDAPGAKAGPPPEKKGSKGMVVTPQALGIALGLILLVGCIAYWQTVIVAKNQEKQTLDQQRISEESRINTYKKKIDAKPQADQINQLLREKLQNLDYLFLEDQSSMMPFFEDDLFPILTSGRLQITGDSALELYSDFEYIINPAMKPFNTLPPNSGLFGENVTDLFPIRYIGEVNGQEVSEPLVTAPKEFLVPYQIGLIAFRGTYVDAMKFVEDLQLANNSVLMTVHCIMNDDSSNAGIYRTVSDWTIKLSVYFMNPERAAQGDNPPDLPGAMTC